MILKIQNGNAWILYDGLSRVQFGQSGEGRVRRFEDSPDWEYRTTRRGRTEGTLPATTEAPDAVYNYAEGGAPPDVDCFDLEAYLGSHLRSDSGKIPVYVYPAWVCAIDTDGNERFFVFNEAFLLNDEGRTIERIR